MYFIICISMFDHLFLRGPLLGPPLGIQTNFLQIATEGDPPNRRRVEVCFLAPDAPQLAMAPPRRQRPEGRPTPGDPTEMSRTTVGCSAKAEEQWLILSHLRLI